MWYQVVENKELAGIWLWLWPQQGIVLPKYEVLIVVSTGCFRRNSKYFRRWQYGLFQVNKFI